MAKYDSATIVVFRVVRVNKLFNSFFTVFKIVKDNSGSFSLKSHVPKEQNKFHSVSLLRANSKCFRPMPELAMRHATALTILSLDTWNCQELKYIIFRSTLIHVLARFQRRTCSQIYFRFSSYLLRKTAFICNIDRDWMIYRKHPIRSLLTLMLGKASILYPSECICSPSKSIKGSNYGEFLKDKNVLLCTRLYKYASNLESLLTQQYVCVMCTLWSDNTCVFTRFHSVKSLSGALILH